jgi:hypothetical protein
VAGAAEAVAGAVDFLDFFFDFFFEVAVEAVDAAVAVEAVVVVVSVFVVLVVEAGLSSANAAPSDRTATATRAESVFFISSSVFPFHLWPARGLPTEPLAQPRCHAQIERGEEKIKRLLRMV